MIKTILSHRGTDSFGSGEFGASRGSRRHNGIDYATMPGAKILSPVDGEVTKLGYPYSDDLSYRYVEITDVNRLRHRVFYCSPEVMLGTAIVKDHTVIGLAQNIAARYAGRGSMTNHVHYEVMSEQGKYLSPER